MIGVYGGTFDPVHYGHLRTALEVQEQLDLEAMLMLPAREPPHRDPPQASPEARRDMLALALQGQDRLVLDGRELERPGPSYMVDTLESLRAEHGDCPLGLVLGEDAFGGLDGWDRWERLTELAHLLVMARPGGGRPAGAPARLLTERGVDDAARLKSRPAGLIYQIEVTSLAISATAIRAQQAAGRSSRYLLPDAVLEYLQANRLYC
ncbi:nicotinic acid mononucleotide adenylyltransferase [Thiohalobacter thiocyanaticus]|uniref:Probable nicotinate-nucleotide adenylyltransferase n=1 Tax=Thiohalobacter thiocyanaticus TaxID=585455 RepID=A0A1Z4VPH0_9GAMM|nr:nicotinate-nucleotide adenylyltransferase [Thiohalobacter thiocyanaticus]BAZ93393.1 nicotinic acid mononucleotide adenylyltransferase [Thiohalobacter thiocyanaticus]